MPGTGIADVVFCLDSSSSMQPCFNAVRQNIGEFAEGLKSDGQITWDLRYDFVSHAASRSGPAIVFRHQSAFEVDLQDALYGSRSQSASFFTSDVAVFKQRLSALAALGDEANFVALDFCLDMPWRLSPNCHRIVVLLTDEALETGLYLPEQRAKTDQLIAKLHDLSVKLFLIGPESAAYNHLAMANGSEYEVVVGGKGLLSTDFRKILWQIGRSVSASQAQPVRRSTERALFSQDLWKRSEIQVFEGS